MGEAECTYGVECGFGFVVECDSSITAAVFHAQIRVDLNLNTET